MIIGMVNAHREAIIALIVQDANGQGHAIDAVIDTGFTGFLTLPPARIAVLGLVSALRPRNVSVPSYRPHQRSGSTRRIKACPWPCLFSRRARSFCAAG